MESMSNYDLSKLVTIIHIDKDTEGNWIYTSDKGKKFFLPKDKVNVITKIDDKFANFVNTMKPITKYFETDTDGETIIYAANFAVDGIPFKDGKVYLIDRKDGRGWAIPGGFIDAGETPEQAVLRELREETLLKSDGIKKIEPIGIFRTNDPREVDFFSFLFLVHVKNSAELGYDDDAKGGKWVLLHRAIKMQLAFTHHNDFLQKIYY
jgi:8-oxo-dGTP diphosphatase